MQAPDTPNPNSHGPRLTLSIIAVAAFQMLVGVLALTMFALGVWGFYVSRQVSVPADTHQVLSALLGAAFLVIITAIGLLRLKDWARLLSLCMATVSVCACAIAATLHKRTPGFDFTPQTLEFALWVLTPVNIWWWILFTRKRVIAQFH